MSKFPSITDYILAELGGIDDDHSLDFGDVESDLRQTYEIEFPPLPERHFSNSADNVPCLVPETNEMGSGIPTLPRHSPARSTQSDDPFAGFTTLFSTQEPADPTNPENKDEQPKNGTEQNPNEEQPQGEPIAEPTTGEPEFPGYEEQQPDDPYNIEHLFEYSSGEDPKDEDPAVVPILGEEGDSVFIVNLEKKDEEKKKTGKAQKRKRKSTGTKAKKAKTSAKKTKTVKKAKASAKKAKTTAKKKKSILKKPKTAKKSKALKKKPKTTLKKSKTTPKKTKVTLLPELNDEKTYDICIPIQITEKTPKKAETVPKTRKSSPKKIKAVSKKVIASKTTAKSPSKKKATTKKVKVDDKKAEKPRAGPITRSSKKKCE